MTNDPHPDRKSERPRRRWRIVLLVFLILGVAGFFSLDALLERALAKVAARMEGSGHRIRFEDVEVSILDGDLRIRGLSIEPVDKGDAADSTTRFILHADDVDLQGVAIWALLTEQVLRVHGFIIHAPTLEHSFATHKLRREGKKEQGPDDAPKGALPVIRIDSLVIDDASGSSVDRAGIRPSVRIAGLDLFVKDVSMEVGPDNVPALDRSVVRLDLRGIAADLPPMYRFTIDSMSVRYPEVTTRVFGMDLTSTVGPMDYHTVADHGDLINMHTDSLALSGFNLLEQMRDGAYRANTVLLFGALFDIHHDKSIPPAPSKRKPLPAEAVLGLPVTIGVDTLRAERCEVRYSERLKRGDEYGTIAFTDIDAVVTGLSNATAASREDLHLHGIARLSGQGRAMLDLRMPMRSSPDSAELTIQAKIEDLPASLLNYMTDNLVHVNATSGHIHRLDLRMQGDDVGATGTVDMQYEELRMELNSSVKHAGILSSVANMVVREQNMPQRSDFREGHFAVERKQDKSVFNYLWLAVKAGCMDVVLPTSVTKGMKKLKKKGGK